MAQELQTCANCGGTIGRLEVAHVWQGHTVCTPCHTRLTGVSQKQKAIEVVDRQQVVVTRIPPVQRDVPQIVVSNNPAQVPAPPAQPAPLAPPIQPQPIAPPQPQVIHQHVYVQAPPPAQTHVVVKATAKSGGSSCLEAIGCVTVVFIGLIVYAVYSVSQNNTTPSHNTTPSPPPIPVVPPKISAPPESNPGNLFPTTAATPIPRSPTTRTTSAPAPRRAE